MAVQDWSSTASSNTSVGGLTTDGNIQTVSNIDGMFRGMMADIRTGINAGSFLGHAYVAKSGNYTALLADWGALFHFTAAATLSLTAASTLTAGWAIVVRARGGAVTIDPNSTELINGASTLVIPDGKSALIVCTGTAFMTAYDAVPSLKQIVRPATGTYTPGTDVKAIWIRAVGGGGGGGGASTAGGTPKAYSGGGGAGAYGEVFISPPAASYAVTLGTGGSAGSGAGVGNGGTGGTTTVSSVLSLAGGTGGANAASAGGVGTGSPGIGGAVITGGSRSYAGQWGTTGVQLAASVGVTGSGGSSEFGRGGGGFNTNSGLQRTGEDGLGFGSGGAGGMSSAAVAANGGVGTGGYVEIWEFI